MFQPGKLYVHNDEVWMAIDSHELVTFNGQTHRLHRELMNWSRYRPFTKSGEEEPDFSEVLKLWQTTSDYVDSVTQSRFYSPPEDCDRSRNLVDYETLDRTYRVFFDNWQEYLK